MFFKGRVAAILKKFQGELAQAIGQDMAESIVSDAAEEYSAPQPAKKKGPGRGHYERNMTCRSAKCNERSKGPRFHYLCPKHLKGYKK